MEGSSPSHNDSGFDSKILWILVWIFTLGIVAVISYGMGKGGPNLSLKPSPVPTTSLQEIPTAPPLSLTPAQIASPSPELEICDKTGPSQKKDYLVSYYMKEGDSITSVAEKELGDERRTTEIIALNEGGPPLAIGSVLYLPPEDIKQSSGHISEISGKIVRKDNTTSWQIAYGAGIDGPGIAIPGFWFKNIATSNFKIGDCVTILFDNSVKVYSIKKS